jgi:DNA polymerase elongation subunit (family B)
MPKRIYVDIETLPPDEKVREQLAVELVRHCQENTPSGVAPENIEEEFRKLALSGEMGRVLAIGVIVERDQEILHRGVIGRDRQTRLFHLDEARTLRGFWRLLNDFNPERDLIIGHNILEFDLSFLLKRSIIHCVRPTVRLSFARYRSRPIFDTMCEWSQWSWKGRVSLDRLAKALGLRSSKEDGIDGSNVYDYFCAGCHEEVAAYCMRDVELVRAIYRRMVFEVEDLTQGHGDSE